MNPNDKLDNNNSILSGAANTANTEEDSVMFGMPKSPGSLLGSSIRSNQVESFDIESESGSITGENSDWRLGMPWFSNNIHSNRDLRKNNVKTNEMHRYYGGIMKASGESSLGPTSPSSMASNNSRHFLPFRKTKKRSSVSKIGKDIEDRKNGIDGCSKNVDNNQKATKRSSIINNEDNVSIPITRTKSNTVDSIADFDESEWTPPDSSYGAACPVCGFVSKRVRQMIEMTLIAAMVFFLIYLVVTTSMKIADAHRREGRSDGSTASGATVDNSTNVVTDDDVYVENYNSNIDGGNGDDAAVLDDYYIDDYNENEYGADDDGGSVPDYSQYYNSNNDYNSNNNGNKNQNYNQYNENNGNNGQNYNYYSGNNANNNQNYNYYNRNRYYRYNDDYNGGRRQLQSSQSKRIKNHSRREMHLIARILD